MRKVVRLIAVLSLLGSLPAYAKVETPKAGGSQNKKSKKIQSEAGLNIPSWGVALDAVYDSRLDDLIPGYKILNIVLSNRSANIIYLDPAKDHWEISDSIGKTHEAIMHLRKEDEKLWAQLPETLKEKLDYPHLVRLGHSAQIDLFFPKNVELLNFRDISWKSAHFKREFNIHNQSENNLQLETAIKDNRDISPTLRQSLEKYDGIPKTTRKSDEERINLKAEEPTIEDNWSIEMK